VTPIVLLLSETHKEIVLGTIMQSSKLDFRIYWPENFKIRILLISTHGEDPSYTNVFIKLFIDRKNTFFFVANLVLNIEMNVICCK
jgi:hypothetical protein